MNTKRSLPGLPAGTTSVQESNLGEAPTHSAEENRLTSSSLSTNLQVLFQIVQQELPRVLWFCNQQFLN